MSKEKKWQTLLRSVVYYITLLFVTLRACDVIDWPWWCVLSPTIAALSFAAILLFVVGVLYASDN